MKFATAALLVASATVPGVDAHGHITLPRPRNNGSIEMGGDCHNYACFWFSQLTQIPGEPTLPDEARTYNVHVSSGEDDWSRRNPWRAPGTAPVLGSGCGVAGGGPKELDNGGIPPPGYKQGVDFLTIPETESTTWKRGSVQEVAFGIFANHGGGYSWRLCNKKDNISEACFQRTVLDFVGDTQVIRYSPIIQWDKTLVIPDYEIPAVRVHTKANGQWTRNPVPGCYICDQAECMRNFSKFDDQQQCSQSCSGLNMTNRICPPGMTQFPEPLSGVSGYYAQTIAEDGLSGFNYNIVDRVQIPKDIEAGDYLLSWRWDCEQSRQIWQNCADIHIE